MALGSYPDPDDRPRFKDMLAEPLFQYSGSAAERISDTLGIEPQRTGPSEFTTRRPPEPRREPS